MAYELIALRQNENNATLTNMHEYRRNETIQVGKYYQVMPFTVDHSIPDSVGLLIETPVGRFIHTGDWKFDKNPLPYRPSTDYNLLESIGNRGVRALLSDSTNAHLSGSSISESEIVRSMEDIFEDATGSERGMSLHPVQILKQKVIPKLFSKLKIICSASGKCYRGSK